MVLTSSLPESKHLPRAWSVLVLNQNTLLFLCLPLIPLVTGAIQQVTSSDASRGRGGGLRQVRGAAGKLVGDNGGGGGIKGENGGRQVCVQRAGVVRSTVHVLGVI